MTNFRLNWVKGDHAQLVGDFDIGDTEGGGDLQIQRLGLNT